MMKDQVKMGQLYTTHSHRFEKLRLEKKQQLQISSQIDVNSSIQDSVPENAQQNFYAGYSPLHFAVHMSSLDLVSEFIRRGASTVKQEAKNQRTPLHLIIDHVNYHKKSINFSNERHSLANALLSAQIQSNIASNPKCNDGISHFHVSCLFNHTAAIEFFIKIGESTDQTTNLGLTPLHCAIKSSSFDAVKILLRNGADMNLKDIKGCSSLVLLAELLIEVNELKTLGKCVPIAIYRDDIKEIESICTLIFRLKTNDQTFFNNSELTVVHMACMLKNKSILKNLLEKGFDFHRPLPRDSKFWPGWTPLHLAACCNVESFELLIQNGANINPKNKKGETPLDLLAMRYTPEIVKKILSRNNKFRSILLSDGLTKLSDVLQAMNSSEEFNNLLTSLPCVNISLLTDSIIWPGFSLLHLSIMMNEKTKEFDKYSNLSKLNKINADDERNNCTEDEIALYMRRIKICLERGCNVSLKNSDGLTPIHLALKMQKKNVVNELLNCCREDAVDPHGLSHFHIACAAGHQNAVELLLSKGADINVPAECCFEWFGIREYTSKDLISVAAQSTPLHIALTLDNTKLAKFLAKNSANIFAEDARGLAPIHLSMRCDWRLAKWLFVHASKNFSESRNFVTAADISYLFIAAHVDDGNAIAKLLQNGAQADVTWPTDLDFLSKRAGLTPLHVAVKMGCDKAVRALVKGGANIFMESPREHDTPLHRAFGNVDQKLFKFFADELKRNETSIAALDSSGLTLLHLACGTFDLDWAKELLESGADVNAIMLRNDNFNDSRIEETPISVLLNKTDFQKGTPSNFINLLRLLIEKGADVTADYRSNCYGETVTPLLHVYSSYRLYRDNMLSQAEFNSSAYYYDDTSSDDDFSSSDDDRLNESHQFREFHPVRSSPLPFLKIADLLLRSQKSYNVNHTNRYGFSHFHYACLRNNVEIVKKYLDNNVDVNQATSFFGFSGDKKIGFSPIHFAFAYHCKEVILLLMENGADVTAEEANGNTPLHIAILHDFINFELFVKLLSQGADINAKNVAGETPLHCLLNRKDLTLEKLEFFIDRGAIIDVSKSESITEMFDAAMKEATSNEVLLVYKRLLKAYDVEPIINSCFNPIHSIVAVYDESRTLDFYLDTIKQFLALGFELNWQNKHGATALHRASANYVDAAVEALLILGADANIVDKFGRAPLYREMYYLDEEDLFENGISYFRYEKTIKILVAHAWKMKLIQLDVINSFAEAAADDDDSAVDDDDSAVDDNDLVNIDASFKSTCQNELKKIENLTIGQVVPLRKFLSEWGAAIEYPMMPLAHREAVDEYFTDADSLRKEFPEFCGLLMLQYRKALDRVELLRSAKCVIVSECEIDLPDLCLEAIFRYFKNDDLRILVADRSSEVTEHKAEDLCYDNECSRLASISISDNKRWY